jgi:2',3'-cyclic-nucleotide 2'-phosphodiesterase/3'-nucleotidase
LIIERDGIRLAVIGVVTPNIPVWDGVKQGVGDLTYEAPETAGKKAIAEIGDRADLIMVSAHMGEYAEFEDNGTDSGIRIVEENPEVDMGVFRPGAGYDRQLFCGTFSCCAGG